MASQQVPTKLSYEKPVIAKEKNPLFMLSIFRHKDGTQVVCKQCSSCHGCR